MLSSTASQGPYEYVPQCTWHHAVTQHCHIVFGHSQSMANRLQDLPHCALCQRMPPPTSCTDQHLNKIALPPMRKIQFTSIPARPHKTNAVAATAFSRGHSGVMWPGHCSAQLCPALFCDSAGFLSQHRTFECECYCHCTVALIILWYALLEHGGWQCPAETSPEACLKCFR